MPVFVLFGGGGGGLSQISREKIKPFSLYFFLYLIIRNVFDKDK